MLSDERVALITELRMTRGWVQFTCGCCPQIGYLHLTQDWVFPLLGTDGARYVSGCSLPEELHAEHSRQNPISSRALGRQRRWRTLAGAYISLKEWEAELPVLRGLELASDTAMVIQTVISPMAYAYYEFADDVVHPMKKPL